MSHKKSQDSPDTTKPSALFERAQGSLSLGRGAKPELIVRMLSGDSHVYLVMLRRHPSSVHPFGA